MSSLRQRWMNRVLHLTAVVAERKQSLLTIQGWSAFKAVVVIVASEVILGVIALPLYLGTRTIASEDTAAVAQFRVRRVMTLSFVILILVLWVAKLGVIITLALTTNSASKFQVSQTEHSSNVGGDLTVAVHHALVDDSIVPPTITSVQEDQGAITITGTTTEDTSVIATISQVNSTVTYPRLYSGRSDDTGTFSIVEDSTVFWSAPGEYEVTVVAYDATTHHKSADSADTTFTNHGSTFDYWLQRVDVMLNVVVIGLIIFGIVVTVLVL